MKRPVNYSAQVTRSMASFMPDAGEPEAWREHAACNDTPREIFFVEQGWSIKDAKAVCATCPVKAECLEYAIVFRERFGVWGGTSERERRILIDQRKAEGEQFKSHPVNPGTPKAHLVCKCGYVTTRVSGICASCSRKAKAEAAARGAA